MQSGVITGENTKRKTVFGKRLTLTRLSEVGCRLHNPLLNAAKVYIPRTPPPPAPWRGGCALRRAGARAGAPLYVKRSLSEVHIYVTLCCFCCAHVNVSVVLRTRYYLLYVVCCRLHVNVCGPADSITRGVTKGLTLTGWSLTSRPCPTHRLAFKSLSWLPFSPPTDWPPRCCRYSCRPRRLRPSLAPTRQPSP